MATQTPAKGLWLEAEGLEFADNFLDLLPGEDIEVPVQGDLSRPIRVSALDQDARDFEPQKQRLVFTSKASLFQSKTPAQRKP